MDGIVSHVYKPGEKFWLATFDVYCCPFRFQQQFWQLMIAYDKHVTLLHLVST